MIHVLTMFIVCYYLSVNLTYMQYKFEKTKGWRRLFITSPLWGLLGFIILPIYFSYTAIKKLFQGVEIYKYYKKALKEEEDERRTG